VFKYEQSEEILKQLTGKDSVVNAALRIMYVVLCTFYFQWRQFSRFCFLTLGCNVVTFQGRSERKLFIVCSCGRKF
jgi:hypothetical protein